MCHKIFNNRNNRKTSILDHSACKDRSDVSSINLEMHGLPDAIFKMYITYSFHLVPNIDFLEHIYHSYVVINHKAKFW